MCKKTATKRELFDCLKDCIQARDVSNSDFKLNGSDLNVLYSVIENMKEGWEHKKDIHFLMDNPATRIYGQFILWIHERKILTTDELRSKFEIVENEIVEQINNH